MGFLANLAGQLQAQQTANSLVTAYDGTNPQQPGQQPAVQPEAGGFIAKLLGLGGDNQPGAPLQLAGAVAPSPISLAAAPTAPAGGLVAQLMGPSPANSGPAGMSDAGGSVGDIARLRATGSTPDTGGPGSGMLPAPQQPSASSTPSFGTPGLPAMAAMQGNSSSPGLNNLFGGVEKKFNLPQGYLGQTMAIEDPSGDPNAVSPTGARGIFQFTKGTAAQYGLSDPTNIVASTYAAGKLASDNAATLTQALGRPPTAGELYLAHQQGAGTAAALLANPNVPAGQVLASIGVNPRNITVNGGDPNAPAGAFAQKFTSKFGSGVGGGAAPSQDPSGTVAMLGGGAMPPLLSGSPYGALDTGAFGPQPGALPAFAASGQGGQLSPATQFAATRFPGVRQADSGPVAAQGGNQPVQTDAQGNALDANGRPTALGYNAATGMVGAPGQRAIAGAAPTSDPLVPVPGYAGTWNSAKIAAAPDGTDVPEDGEIARAQGGGAVAPISSGTAPGTLAATSIAPVAQQPNPQAAALNGQALPTVQPSQNVTATIRTLLRDPNTMALGQELWKSMLTKTPPAFQHIETTDGRVLVFNPATGGLTVDPNVQGSPAPTEAVKNFQFAKSQGYAGTFTDYQASQTKDTALKFGVIGEDQYGNKQYGTFNPTTGKVTPQAAAGSGGAAAALGQPGVTDLHGADFLGTLGQNTAGQVKAIVEGRAPYPTGMLLKTPYGQQLAAYVTQTDPSFEAGNSTARMKVRNEFLAGGPSSPAGMITAGNTAIQHLGHLSDAAEALDNTFSPDWNGVANATAQRFGGGTAVTQFNNILGKYVEEATKFYRGSGGTEADIQRDLGNLSPNMSPAQLHTALQTQVELLQSKINALQDRWKQGMGPMVGDFPIIQPDSQGSLDKIAKRAGVAPTNTTGAQQGQAGAPPAPAPSQGGRVQIRNATDYQSLPSGTRYTDPNGQPRIKP